MKKSHLLLILSVILISCEEQIPELDAELLISDDLIIVDEPTNQSLIYIDSAQLEFANSTGLGNVQQGTYIVSGTTSMAPYGYLRKVEYVENGSGSVKLVTSNASLTDIIVNCDVSFNKLYSIADTGTGKTNFLGFTGTYERVVKDMDGDLSTTDDQIVLTVGYDFQPEFLFDLVIKRRKVKYAKLGVSVENTGFVTFRSGSVLHLEKEIELYRQRLHPVVFHIGPIPVVFTSTLVVSIGVTGELLAEIETGISGTSTSQAYVEYSNGTWNPESTRTINTTYQPVLITGSATVRAFLGAALDYKFYDMENVKSTLKGEIYLAFNGTCQPQAQNFDCDWMLKSGIAVYAQLNVRVLQRELLSYNQEIFDYCTVIADNSNDVTFFTIENPQLIWGDELNQCYMDEVNAYGTDYETRLTYDNSFDEFSYFEVDIFGNFSTGEDDYDFGDVNDDFIDIDYSTNTISIRLCTHFGPSDWVDQTIIVYNDSYRSNSLTMRVYKPAGANKEDTGISSTRTL